ncbi:MAG TPA: 3'-5' exonuclease [Verrucomicrobiae bacterium]|nr:3'-5' exonuclease [Verrucomicrobiae bacterium]
MTAANPPAREIEIAVIDLETTGDVRGYEAEPWQIGIVVLSRGRIDPAPGFESLLRVGDRPFNPRAPGQHHRLRREIAVAPTLPGLWPMLRQWIEGRPLAAHNAPTERKFLSLAAPLHTGGPWIDTLRLARAAYPSLPSHALQDVVGALNLLPRVQELCPGREPHDALFDAFCCAAILESLLAQEGWRDSSVALLAAQ